MAVIQKGKGYDEALINYFIEAVCGEADPVYRFAFVLTLSLDGAHAVVEKVFEEIAASLESHYKTQALPPLIVAETWKAYEILKKNGYKEGHSAVIKALKKIPEKARAALFSVDVIGLQAPDAAQAFGWDEKELRHNLAVARKELMTSSVSF